MKNRVIFFIIILFLFSFLNSCASIKENKQKDIFLQQFINNDGIINSLESFYSGETITIYDENKVLVKAGKTFNTASKRVDLVILKPQNNQYITIKNFILNRNLTCLTFLNSDREEGIIIYLKRRDNNDEWKISNMLKQGTR